MILCACAPTLPRLFKSFGVGRKKSQSKSYPHSFDSQRFYVRNKAETGLPRSTTHIEAQDSMKRKLNGTYIELEEQNSHQDTGSMDTRSSEPSPGKHTDLLQARDEAQDGRERGHGIRKTVEFETYHECVIEKNGAKVQNDWELGG